MRSREAANACLSGMDNLFQANYVLCLQLPILKGDPLPNFHNLFYRLLQNQILEVVTQI